jgi:hypothetical protein
MSARNYQRPSIKTRGRLTENINGGDIPREFYGPPLEPRQSKAEMRAETDRLVAEFIQKRPDDRKGGAR